MRSDIATRRILSLKPGQAKTAPSVASAPVAAPATATTEPAHEPASLKLGDINGRIGPLQISAAGMEQLGIRPARIEGSARLYREIDYRRLLVEIAQHIEDRRTVVAA